jgi:16S rRNA (guanine966-N2)-methyltransferase
MRVIAGRFGGRRLFDAPREGVRPTSDRVREALFARLGALHGLRVLDLYAGTGTLGIEALSRGAARAVFIERSRPALAVLERNLAALGLDEGGVTRVVRGDVATSLRRLARPGPEAEAFERVFIDPPYASGEAVRALEALVSGGLLAPDAEVVVEASRRHPVGPVPGLELVDERRYGDTLIVRFAPSGGGDEEAPEA